MIDLALFQPLKDRLQVIEDLMQSPTASANPRQLQDWSIEYNDLKTKLGVVEGYEQLSRAISDAREMVEQGDDAELADLARVELEELLGQQTAAEQALHAALLPTDPNDQKGVIIEIRAGAGGDEAALFASELFRSYSRYAENQRWQIDLISQSQNGIGGLKEVIASLHGRGAYSDLKYESGVHRVQRIPETEKAGRVHTSTVTVAVMPEAEEIDLEIKDGELRIDVFRAGGHGGQSVNTTDSAVRITHLPTGMIVTCQDEKSQHKNKAKAMSVLRSRLLAQMEEAEALKRGSERRSQIGTGDRSEKIRTYNIPQDRVTDHRIKQNWSNVAHILQGNLEPLIQALRQADQERQLENLKTAF